MAYLSNYSANSQYVVKAFSALFGAGVTGDLIASGDTILTAGNSKTALVNVLLNNSVVLNAFPLFGANITDTAFAGALIDNMTKGSGVDATTIAGWKTAVAAALPSYPSRAAAVATLIDSVTNYSGSDANLALVKAVVNNRAEVGAFKAQNGASTFSTLSSLQTQVASVDTTDASVTAAQTATNEAATSYVLTTAQDLFTGTNADNVFRAVAGNANGTQDQTTLNSSDIIDGGVGADTLIVNMTGANYNGGARIKNIETLQIGTNQAAATFDYNVNAGSNEVTEVKTIVADQINTGEALTINNLVRDNATAAIPAMSWVNDNTGANGLAGTVNLNYRAATVSGTADEQALSLTNVRAGTLNLATGIEKVTLTSAGTATNSIDKVQSGTTLTDVVIKAAAQLGGNRVVSTADATKGLEINRTATNANTEHNSFVNMGASVKNVTAEGSAAGVNIAFTDTTAVDNTFVGGDGADSVIVNGGNDKLSGGKGADTFIFGQTNTSANGTFFNNSDTIDGGEGTDTIQIDYAGTAALGQVVIQTSEWLNSKGLDALDLRAQNTRVQLDDAFVGRADAGSFEVITNKIVQNDSTTSVADEANSRHQIDLTTVTASRAVKVTGGEGRETVIVTDALNGVQTISGGNGLDALVVQNGATLTGQDLQNVSGINVFNLVKTSANAQSFQIDLTADFLTKAIDANAAAGTSKNTANAFRIVTDTTDTNGATISGVQTLAAGDSVTITVDTTTGLKTVDAINIRDLIASNATITVRNTAGTTLLAAANGAVTTNTGIFAGVTGNNYTYTDLTTNPIAGVGTPVASGQASTGGGAAPATGNTFTLTAAGAVLTNAASNLVTPAATYLGAGSDTITAGINFLNGSLITDTTTTDADVLNATITGVNAAVINGIETINLQSFGGTLGLATVTGATTVNVTGAAATFTGANAETIVIGSGFTGLLTAAGTAVTDTFTVRLNGTAAGTSFSSANTAGITFNVAAASTLDTLTMDTGTASATASATITGAGNLTVTNALVGLENVIATDYTGALSLTLSNGASTVSGGSGNDTITGGIAADTIFGGAGSDTINVSQNGADTVRGGAGNDTITLGGTDDDRVVFENSSANNGTDTITGFRAGDPAAVDADLLDFTAFVTGRYVNNAGNVQTDTNVIAAVFSAAENNDSAVNNSVVAFDSVTALTVAEIAAEFNGAANAFAVVAGQRTVVLEGNAAGATRGVNAYFVHDADGNGVIADAEVVLVGTINAGTFLDLNTIVSNQIL